MHDRRIVLAIPHGNAMPPPQLAADAPVLDVGHPVFVNFRPALGDKADLARRHRIEGGRHLRIAQKPLLAQPRLDRHIGALAVADVVLVILHAHEQPHLLEFGCRGLARREALHAGELRPGQFVERAVGVHHVEDLQTVALTDLEVRLVVRRRHFEHAGAEGHVDVRVGDDRNFRPRERTHRVLAEETRIPRIVRMHRHRRVAHQGLGARRGDLEERPRFLRHLVAHDVELAPGGLHDDLLVAQGGLRHRTPVDHALAAVDESLGVQPDENLLHLARVIRVHGETLPVPVAGTPEALELFDDDPAVLFLPLPHPPQKFLAPQIAPRFPFLLAQLPLDHRLRGDARVVRPRQPKDLVPGLARAPRQDVLQGVVQYVAERQHAGHVGRRDDDAEAGLGRGRIGREAARFDPFPIPPFLHGAGLVGFGNFGHRTGDHSGFSPALQTQNPRNNIAANASKAATAAAHQAHAIPAGLISRPNSRCTNSP